MVEIKQDQKIGRTPTVVQATGATAVACSTGVQPWSVALAPATGQFLGNAEGKAQTANAAPWITPANAVKSVRLFWTHK